MKKEFIKFLKNRPKEDICNHTEKEWCSICVGKNAEKHKVTTVLPDGTLTTGYVYMN